MQEKTENILSINQNIIQFIDFIGLNRYKFSKKTGISESVLLNIYKGKNKPSVDILEKILNIYPALNLNWLFTGNGNILLENQELKDAVKIKSPVFPCAICSEKERVISALEKANQGLQEALESYKMRCKDQTPEKDTYKQTGSE